MDAMLGGKPSTGLDAAGSLVVAEEAAWLAFLNLRRLPEAAATLRSSSGMRGKRRRSSSARAFPQARPLQRG